MNFAFLFYLKRNAKKAQKSTLHVIIDLKIFFKSSEVLVLLEQS